MVDAVRLGALEGSAWASLVREPVCSIAGKRTWHQRGRRTMGFTQVWAFFPLAGVMLWRCASLKSGLPLWGMNPSDIRTEGTQAGATFSSWLD